MRSETSAAAGGGLRSTAPADRVPVLVAPETGLVLRGLRDSDLPGIIETCTDPETVRFTPVPAPYGVAEARAFLRTVRTAWERGVNPFWALEAERDGQQQFCGSVGLGPDVDQLPEVGFTVHPAARGRGLASAALRLVRDHALDVLGVAGLRWRSRVGHWASRRVAAAAGFRFEGRVRSLLLHRGTLVDGWQGTLLADDPRDDLRWAPVPQLIGAGVVLRPFADRDAARVAEACSDPRTRHWLASLPDPYGLTEARDYIESTREDAASGAAFSWCVADPTDDRCLGAISLDGFGAYHRRSEIGYWAHPDARARGVISEAVRVASAYALEELGRGALLIRCARDNLASRQVAVAGGFREAGTLFAAEPLGDGSLSDLVVYARP